MEQDETPIALGQTSWTYSINKRTDKIWRVSTLEADWVLNPRFLIRRILMFEDARGLSPFCRLHLVARLSKVWRISMLEADWGPSPFCRLCLVARLSKGWEYWCSKLTGEPPLSLDCVWWMKLSKESDVDAWSWQGASCWLHLVVRLKGRKLQADRVLNHNNLENIDAWSWMSPQ